MVLAGSRSEYLNFVHEHDDAHNDFHSIAGPMSLFGYSGLSMVLHVVGTGHFTKHYAEITKEAMNRGIAIIDHCFPKNTIVMPSMEIVHDYADRMGISPEWRHRGPEQDPA